MRRVVPMLPSIVDKNNAVIDLAPSVPPMALGCHAVDEKLPHVPRKRGFLAL